MPGLIVSQHSGDGKANQYYLRGFNLDHGTDFATFVDGMPINMRTHAHGQGYTDLNFLIPELVSRIDYKKGTYYADEGDFASAGAAHLSLIDSLDRGIATITGGEHRYARGLIANSNAFGSGNLLYAVDATYNNGPWDLAEHARRVSGVLRYSQGSAADGFSLTAMGYDARWTSTDQIPQRAVDDGLIDRFGAIDPSDGGKTSRYSLSFDAVKTNDFGLLRFNAYAVASRMSPSASAGWQQVKTSRSRSSCTAPSSRGSSGSLPPPRPLTRAAWACRSSRVPSRRIRSIARRRAVVMIHPAGLGGTPSAGQRRSASTNASWTASSAASMSPNARTSTATARPCSARNTRPTSAASGISARHPGTGAPRRTAR